eukprot:230824-Pleurochrysis_carterae.AAC.1
MQGSVSPCLRGLALSSAHCPGCLAAVCCVCHAHARFPIHASGDRMFGFAREGGQSSRRASLTASVRTALLDALTLPVKALDAWASPFL